MVGPNGCATQIEQNINVLSQSPIINNCNCCTVTALKAGGGIPSHILTYRQDEPQPISLVTTSNLSIGTGSICDACNVRLLPQTVYSYIATSPEINMVFYTVNTNGVLSSPFPGGYQTYKFNWGGSIPTEYDVCVIDENGVVVELIDCATACVSYSEYTGSGYGNTVYDAAVDASINNRTLYSTCNSLSFGSLCTVLVNSTGTPLLGYTVVYINFTAYDVNPGTGMVIGPSAVQP
jgi:hypothetical protein